MASETTSSLVLFIAALAIAGIAAAAMAGVVADMAGELQDRGDAMAEAIGTDIAIVNDPDNIPWDGSTLTIYIKNTGSSTLAANETTILVDGQHATYTTKHLDGQESWRTGVVVEFTVTPADTPAGDTRVLAGYATVSDHIEFRV